MTGLGGMTKLGVMTKLGGMTEEMTRGVKELENFQAENMNDGVGRHDRVGRMTELKSFSVKNSFFQDQRPKVSNVDLDCLCIQSLCFWDAV